MNLSLRIRIEKTATDNGFDLDLPAEGDWLSFASSQTPLRIWLTAPEDRLLVVAVSQIHVLNALEDPAPVLGLALPEGARGAVGTTAFSQLHLLLRRIFQLSRSLPDTLHVSFQKKTANLPKTTEVERLVVQRVGQDLFRAGLMDYWDGRCAISGLAVPELLRASHIKPWADCATDAERLDVFNGFLLAAHLDAAFDCGFITVGEDGRVIVSEALDAAARGVLGLDRGVRMRGSVAGHREYLEWHQKKVYRGAL